LRKEKEIYNKIHNKLDKDVTEREENLNKLKEDIDKNKKTIEMSKQNFDELKK
jgi:peptidoglycan hydrolase CwlO-like protein